ncbi:MAG: dehydrogenase, partial [Planctomycetes bacterium]|nr:dehydrogenase [Planctomycetota bacterium]
MRPYLFILAISLCCPLPGGEKEKFKQPELIIDERFTIELAAAPPLVEHPMLATLDPQGRMFISESDGQNLQKAELLKQRSRFVRMLEDTDRDGVFDKSTIFADKMVMPEGALWHQGALYIISSPYLWRLEDTDGDGVADRRDKIMGYMEFDGRANQHGPWLGPNGLLYFTGGIFGYDLVGTDGVHAAKGTSAGVFSCRTDGSDIRVVCHAGINPVELAFTPWGDMLGTCAIFDSVGGRHDSLSHWIHGGQYGPKDYGSTREGAASLKRTGYRLGTVVRWGQVAPAGLLRYRGEHLGKEYRGDYFSCHFNTHAVHRSTLLPTGSTFGARDEVFLRSPSIDFHPTDVMEDQEGSLLVIDTGGWLSWGCPTSKLAKPQLLGSIYRIRRKIGAKTTDPLGVKVDWKGTSHTALARLLADQRPLIRDR